MRSSKQDFASARPLVSITTPVYNSRREVHAAYAAVLSQTYSNWEWIVVDDGSNDGVADFFARNPDPRVRFSRDNQNRGRSVARQRTIELAEGKYICMLDADDWMLSSRLEKQVAFLEKHPDCVLVSSSMAIVRKSGDLVGIRGFNGDGVVGNGDMAHTFEMHRPRIPEVAFAPSMFRRAELGQARYDPRLLLGEDSHFLIAYLRGRKYASLPESLYVYAEESSLTLDKLLGRLRYSRSGLLDYFGEEPVTFAKAYASSLAKGAIYRCLWRLGLRDLIVRKGTRTPSAEEYRCFVEERKKVAQMAARLVD